MCCPGRLADACLLPQGDGPLAAILDLIEDELYRVVIEDMLSVDPRRRPTEKEVMAAVSSESADSAPSCSHCLVGPVFYLDPPRVYQ